MPNIMEINIEPIKVEKPLKQVNIRFNFNSFAVCQSIKYSLVGE